MRQNRFRFFHSLIITFALFLLALALQACGYKADPYYEKQQPSSESLEQ